MEFGQPLGYGIYMPLGHLPPLEEPGHHGGLGELPHLDRILQDLPSSAHSDPPIGPPAYGHYPQVEIRADGRVDPDLLLAVEPPLLQGCEVQEAEVHWFLYLVGVSAREEDEGDVCLNEPDLLRPLAVSPGIQESSYDLFRGHGMGSRWKLIILPE